MNQSNNNKIDAAFNIEVTDDGLNAYLTSLKDEASANVYMKQVADMMQQIMTHDEFHANPTSDQVQQCMVAAHRIIQDESARATMPVAKTVEEVKRNGAEIVISDLGDPKQDELRRWLLDHYPTCTVSQMGSSRRMVFFKGHHKDPKWKAIVADMDKSI